MGIARRLSGQLYVQVLAGMLIGVAIGFLWPDAGAHLKPVADGFIKLIKMLLAPIIFGTVVVGIAQMGSLKEVGRLGFKALVYFEILSTIALAIGLLVANLMQPGAGMNIDAAALDTSTIEAYRTTAAADGGITGFLLGIIPDSFLGAFVMGSMLQVILLSLLVGLALSGMGEAARPIVDLIELLNKALFRIVGMVMRLAPLGAGAGMAFTIGKYGLDTLWSLGHLLVALYVTTFFFIVVVLGTVMRIVGLSFLGFLRYIRDEILVVLGTCSTEAVLPQMMRKLETMGVARPVVGMVLPAGYTFNTDGTCIYLTMATIFIAQATNTPLSVMDQIVILAVLMLTSKGSAGVAGAGFVTLAATLSAIPAIPVAGLVLLLGIDRFLNEARAVTNLIGNGVATLAVARWDGALDRQRAEAVLSGKEVSS
ncbi:aerobic C4-dicarboxylate transport protein [Sphingopyxis sp. OAS728]|uniref:C4-dicarboxylate transporter DctA n=1 Tax=Sphingopyxis sp. OAS728 TaxID=2663823 RepID=UPI001789B1A8|nr:C4-dicarboxylate transporter DctA [Sphingopyxis sp. OAS728]MBE1529023.1 aerobic C4-dicarboxylate transport protein [Sphingopyxis sp. OAS728]